VARAVLLVDDDELVLAHLSPLVQAAGFAVSTANDGATALAVLEQRFTPIVIADLNMPAMDGLALCRAIRQHEWPGYVYIMLLTVHDGETDILAGLAAGADDYLSKRTSPAQLLARLHTARRILGLEQALKSELEEKRRQSLTDELTGAHNRRYFEQHLQIEFKRALRGGDSLCLLMLDIDHFKHINDRFGHAAGDAVLQELVRRIAQCLPRVTDWSARVGGEEFVIVLGSTALAGAAQVAERIRECIAGAPVPTSAGAIGVTASIGVVEFHPAANGESVPLETLLRELDSNLYLSKQQGRNRVTLPAARTSGGQEIGQRTVAQEIPPVHRPLRTILYVDDEPDIRLIVQTALSLAPGLTVHTADSCAQALELARTLQPDLVLLDVMMPGVDGPTTLQRLRADPAIARMPVIFMTAKAMPADVERLRAMGASAVIAKPFDPMQLSAQVLSLWHAIVAEAPSAGADGADRAPLQEQVARLAGKFLQRTEAQAVTLRRIGESLLSGDQSGVASMQEIAHKIHGSGAMFNFPDVSQCAGEIERLSQTLLDAEPDVDPASESRLRQRLQASIQQLSSAVDSAVAAHAAR
jgi:diguanylate cyclase (GGDEF)-like protein